MAKVFLLTGKRREQPNQVILANPRGQGGYKFENGALVVLDDDVAKAYAPILVDFFACKMVTLEEYEEAVLASSPKGKPDKGDKA